MPCSNNVIWRLTTGKRTQQDDPEMKDLTGRIQNNFQTLDPSSPLALLQMNSLAFTKILKHFGFNNFLDSTKKVMEVLVKEVEESTPFEGGTYTERALHEGTSERASVFRKVDGKNYLVSQLADLFIAGNATPIAKIVMKHKQTYITGFS